MAPTHRSRNSSADNGDRAWSEEEDKLLLRLVKEYGSERGRRSSWPLIASYFGGKRTMKQCRKRYFYTLDSTITHGKWSREEDNKLLSLIDVFGHKWKEISFEMTGRTDDQCSSRYLNCLQCKKTPWTAEEDATLLNLYEVDGPLWTKISSSLPGRSALNCRNRYRKFGGKVYKARKLSASGSKKDYVNSDSQNESTDGSTFDVHDCANKSSDISSSNDIENFNVVVARMFPQLVPQDAFNTLFMMQLNAIPTGATPIQSDASPLFPEEAEFRQVSLPPSSSPLLFDFENVFTW